MTPILRHERIVNFRARALDAMTDNNVTLPMLLLLHIVGKGPAVLAAGGGG